MWKYNIPGKGKQELEAFLISGKSFENGGQIELAIENYEKALKLAEKLNDKHQITNVCMLLAYCYYLSNKFKTAIENSEKALEIAKEQRDKPQEADTYLVLRYVFNLNNKYQTAIGYYKKTLETAKKLADKDQETTAYIGLLYAYRLNNQCQAAIEYYEKTPKISKKQADKRRKKEAKAYIGLGHAYRSSNHYQTAIEHYEKALEITKIQVDKRQETAAYIGLGYAYTCINQYQTAIGYYEKAVEIAKKRADKGRETDAYIGLGHAYRLNNKNETAIEYFEKALEISEKQADKGRITETCIGLGHTYTWKNQCKTAIDFYEKALEIAKIQADKGRETEAYIGLRQAYRLKNQYQTAIEYYEKALEIAKKQADTGRETAAYRLNNQCQTAIENLEKALNIARKQADKGEETEAYIELGHAYQSSNQKQTATDYFEKAFEIATVRGNKQNQIDLSFNVGNVHYLNENVTALNYWEKVTKQAGKEKYEEVKALASIEKFKKLEEDHNSLRINSELPLSSKWKQISITHREKFIELFKYGHKHPNELKNISGVRICCTNKDFLIGKGADGTRVYLGISKDGFERAVKRLPKDACTSVAEQEMKVLTQYKSSESNNVIRYWSLDNESDKENLYLILDLCEETLKNYVDRQSLDKLLTSAPKIIQQILKGLVDLHSNPDPILHRDLKPSNILRDVHDRWLLADFGISRILKTGETTYESKQRGTKHWRAVESYFSKDMSDGQVCYKKESDIQVAGMLAHYIVTKGEHPFGEEADRQRNLLDGKPVGLDMVNDEALKDLLTWMLNHSPKNRPSAEEALKHPYLQTKEQQFELLCNIGNQPEIKTRDVNSVVVQQLNSDSTDWRTRMNADVLKYLSTDFLNAKPRTFKYDSSWTECLRLIRNVHQHWKDRPRPRPQPKPFYIVGNPQEYFLEIFPNLPVFVHRIVRLCDWKKRPELQKYFK